MGSLVSGGVGALRPAVVVLAGLAMLGFAGPLWASFIDDRHDVEAYRAAPMCAVPSEDWPPTCIVRLPATIERTESTWRLSGRERKVHFRLDGGEPEVVEVEHSSAAFEALEPGKSVLMVLWDPFIARIELLDGRATETAESPFASRARSLSLALVFSAMGLSALAMGIRARRDTGAWWLPARPIPGRIGLSSVIGLALAGGVTAVIVAGHGVYDIGSLLARGGVGFLAGGFIGTALYLWRRSSVGAASGR